MADVKISELTALTTPSGGDELVVNDSGTTKKITIEDLFAGDNVRAKFGAGDDLQIYHNGSASYIDDSGTGDLNIRTNQLWVEKYTGEVMIWAASDGAVTLYHDNASKLATAATGVNISGTVAASNGTAALPAFTFVGDTNNGMFKAGNDEIGFSTASTERMRINGWGNVGIGVVPEAWSSTFDAIQFGDQGSIFGQNSGTQSVFGHNVYHDGAYKYITTSQASRYVQSGGSHVWSVAPSGSADAAISWTTAMTINNSGRVGIGTSSPTTVLQVEGVGGSRTISGVSANLNSRFRPNGQGGIEVLSTASNVYLHNLTSGGATIFSTRSGSADHERMRIDSSGAVSIGHTSGTGSKFAVCDGANSQIQFFPEVSTDTNLTQHYDPTASAYINAETRAASHAFKTGTTERMRIDSAGRVTQPYQPAATAGWTSAVSAPTTLPASNILTNVGSHLASNGRFTCPIAGIYHVSVAYMSNASGNTRVHLRKNGSEYGAGTMVAYQNHSSTYGAASAQGYISCSANDYLEWYLDAGYVQLHSGHGQINFALFS